MAKATQFETDDQTHHTQPAWNLSSDETNRFLAYQNPDCDNHHVDSEFARIFGGNDAVYACSECTAWAALKSGQWPTPSSTIA